MQSNVPISDLAQVKPQENDHLWLLGSWIPGVVSCEVNQGKPWLP